MAKKLISTSEKARYAECRDTESCMLIRMSDADCRLWRHANVYIT